MDFNWSEEQAAITQLAEEVLSNNLGDEVFSGAYFAQKAWLELARTELLSVAVDPAFGGSGMGLMELLLLLRQAGCHAAPLPLLESIVMAAPLIQAQGSQALKEGWLAALGTGERVLSLALHEGGGSTFSAPVCSAEQHGDSWQVSGRKIAVPFAEQAHGYVVLAAARSAPALFLIAADQAHTSPQVGTDDHPLVALDLQRAEALLISDDAQVVAAFERRFQLAISALLLGLAERALELTAAYLSERRQFGVPIGSFQAVSQRVGDAFIALETMRVSLWRAAWLEAEGRASEQAVVSARYLASRGAHQVVAAAQHLHGGMGFDRDYPLHRYFLGVKRIDFLAGSASAQLERLGTLVSEGA